MKANPNRNTVRKRYFYGYDAQSRLFSKQEEGLDDLPAYVYAPGKNRILRIPGHELIRILKRAHGTNAM